MAYRRQREQYRERQYQAGSLHRGLHMADGFHVVMRIVIQQKAVARCELTRKRLWVQIPPSRLIISECPCAVADLRSVGHGGLSPTPIRLYKNRLSLRLPSRVRARLRP